MKAPADTYVQQQEKVNAYFTSQSSFWRDIYAGKDVYAYIHQERHLVILDWIKSLGLDHNARILEIGCGAGFLSIEFARCGFHVDAIDSSKAMVEQARHHAMEAGVSDALSFAAGDVYSLSFADASFDLVVAVGVIPWLSKPELALKEMARVIRPGGSLIFTVDNRARLNIHLDPSLYPGLKPLKRRIKQMLHRTGMRRQSPEDVDSHFHTRRYIDGVLSKLSFVKSKSKTLGFGPFTFLRVPLLPRAMGIALHRRLQRLADQNMPIVRATGSHYIVLAEKTPVSSLITGQFVPEAAEASSLESARIHS